VLAGMQRVEIRIFVDAQDDTLTNKASYLKGWLAAHAVQPHRASVGRQNSDPDCAR